MYRKGLIFLSIFYLAGIVSSCIFDVCDDYKYYDFHKAEIVARSTYVPVNDSLYLKANEKDFEYFALNFPKDIFFNSAYAFGCEKGWGGEMYALTRISIKSDSDFSDEFPAGSELNSIIRARGTNSQGHYIMGYMSDFLPADVNYGHLWIVQRPELDDTHRFTVEFEKSNGEIVTATSEVVSWQ